VYRARDRGRTWDVTTDGLPATAWAAVLHEAPVSDAESLSFGTQSGPFIALTAGDRWVEGLRHLPPILSVEVTQRSDEHGQLVHHHNVYVDGTGVRDRDGLDGSLVAAREGRVVAMVSGG